ncbi:MAG: hypothetical protein ACLR8P_18905 [Clostridium fessum]
MRAQETCADRVLLPFEAGSFTGTRCGYTVVPSELERGGSSIRKMWLRRQTTKFNGVSTRYSAPQRQLFARRAWRSAASTWTYTAPMRRS